MIDDGTGLFTIGELARVTGLSVRTIRFWSDEGALPPAARSAVGYRLYDAASVARLELIRTLRELGLGLSDVRRVVTGGTTVAEIAATHVAALDAQIGALQVTRAVLSTVARRGSTAEEMTLMNRLARLSAAERKRITDGFMEETFAGLDAADPDIRTRMRFGLAELPEDPTPGQMDAWVELAGLLQDRDFRARMRKMVEFNAADRGTGVSAGTSLWFMSRLVQLAGSALERGFAPESPAAEETLGPLLGNADRAAVLELVESAAQAEMARFRELNALVRGTEPLPAHRAEFAWVVAALRARAAR